MSIKTINHQSKNEQYYDPFNKSPGRVNHSSSARLKLFIMEKQKNTPEEKFKQLLKGSVTARNLSFIYILISLMLAFRLREDLFYVIPLLLGAALITWYTITHLLIHAFTQKEHNLKTRFQRYKLHILKREKHEYTVFFIWFLTIVPAYLYEEEITILTVLKSLVVIYIIFILGNHLFGKVKDDLKAIEQQINCAEANNFNI